MIVRNEAQVLARCLTAARKVVDAAVICDTGSRDATPALAERVGLELDLPLHVVQHEWIDFGANRTRAIEAALDAVAHWGFDLASTWLLFLDADQVLTLQRPWDPTALTADAYLLAQGNGDERYWNLRLVRADRRLRYVGATHEYLDLPTEFRRERLEGARVTDHNDGGARGDKFERDRRLLTEALRKDPSDARALFYLARTYRALGERMKALALFRRRARAGGWMEEVWDAWFESAQILHEAGETRAAREALHEARRADRARAEALELLARLHREAGRRERAAALALRGLSLPYPADRLLFLDRRTYAYGLRAELARAAAGTRHAERGFDALEALLVDRDVPAWERDGLRNELAAYAGPWTDARYVRLAPRLPAPYVPCNPSVIAEPDGYLVNCRAVNYLQRNALAYEFPEGDGVVRTRNVLMRLAPDLSVRDEREIHGVPPPPREARIQGLEDMRLLRTAEGLLGFAVTADRHPSGLVGMCVVRLAEDGQVRSVAALTGQGHLRVEKNWVPYLGPAGEPRLIYALEPLTRLTVDPVSGACRVLEERQLAWDLSGARGSGGPVPFEREGRPGELLLVHEVALLPGWRRRYLHRFVWLDADGAGAAATRAFWFRGLGVEFAAGLCRAHEPGDLLVSLGVEDREAWLARIPAESVRARLRPLPARPPGA